MNPKSDAIRFECTKCGACCRENSLLVTVTGRDIARISMGLELDSNEVIRALDFYLVSGNDIPKGLLDIPAVKTEQGPAYIALKKLENGDCIFLKDDLCMIHPIRPAVCMSFPFVFWDKDGEHTWGLSAKKAICPGLGTGPEVEVSELQELAVVVLEELALYEEFVERWNCEEKNPSSKTFIERILSNPTFSV
ncbi:MAG: YkgJ family cysteine cluster protein [Candidatus Thorarchaeota archaeon]